MSRSRPPAWWRSLLALLLVAAGCSQRDDDDDSSSATAAADRRPTATATASPAAIDTADCAADPTRRRSRATPSSCVSSFPQSGLTAAFAEISNGWKAYFQIHQRGGGRRRDRRQEVQDRDRGQGRRVQRAEDRRRTSRSWSAPTATGAFARLQRRRHGQQHRHPRPARRALRAEPLRRHRLAGLGQPGVPVADRLDARRLHARGPGRSPTTSRRTSPTPRSPCSSRTTTSGRPTRRASRRPSRAPTSRWPRWRSTRPAPTR